MSTGPLNELAEEIHRIAREHGFWEKDRNFGEIIALIHSEATEALEEHRAGNPVHYYDDTPPLSLVAEIGNVQEAREAYVAHRKAAAPSGAPILKPEGTAVELGDCIIRCLDALHSMGVDIDAIVAEKMAYNDSRPHKHGKAY